MTVPFSSTSLMAANEAALMRPTPWALSDWMPFISKSTGPQGEWAIPPRNWKKSRICWANVIPFSGRNSLPVRRLNDSLF